MNRLFSTALQMARSPRKRATKVPQGKLRKLSDHLKASHKALAKSPLFSKNIKGKRSPAQVEKELAAVLKKVRSKLQQAEKLLQTLPSKKKSQETEPSDVADDERDDVEPQEDLEEDVA